MTDKPDTLEEIIHKFVLKKQSARMAGQNTLYASDLASTIRKWIDKKLNNVGIISVVEPNSGGRVEMYEKEDVRKALGLEKKEQI